jgi:hypothetical protein
MRADGEHHQTRQERREQRAQKRREMRTHGANLAQIYRNAVLKRIAAIARRRKGA